MIRRSRWAAFAALVLLAACAGPRPKTGPTAVPSPPIENPPVVRKEARVPPEETWVPARPLEPPAAPEPKTAELPPPVPEPPPVVGLEAGRTRFEEGRFEATLEALAPLGDTADPEVWRLRADSLAALGHYPAALDAYRTASSGSDEVSAQDLRARMKGLLDAMDAVDLARVAEACPLCSDGGYARLRLARLALGEGRDEVATGILRDLEADFPGTEVGRAAANLWESSRSDQPVHPGLYGILLPFSGPLERFGDRALRGAALAAGLFGDEDSGVRLAVADSGGDPVKAVAAVEDLAQRGVVGIVGPLKGDATRAAADRARELGLPMVTPTPAADVAGGGVFRIGLRPADEVSLLVDYAVDALGLERFAILYPETPEGARYRDLFWDRVVDRGARITAVRTFAPDASDVSDAIQKATGVYRLTRAEIRERFLEAEGVRLQRERALLEALGIDETSEGDNGEIAVDQERLADYEPPPIVDFEGVFLPVSSTEAAEIAPRFPFLDVEGVRLLGVRTWNYPTLVDLGDEYVEGAVFPAEMHPDLPGAREFVTRYRNVFGEDPGVIEAYVYDAVNLLAREGAEVETRRELRRRLGGLWSVGAATGPLTSAPGGEIAARPKMLTVRHGRIIPAPTP